jgi:phenylpropionate dioxygenase-like ring-hydroxylating dioxygenase large terminal subunit
VSYLRNAWYVAAWSEEVTAVPLARTLLGEPLVFFRTAAGAAGALLDRCPHRFAKLSMGKVVGAGIECRYHGLRFDEHGACIANPHGPVGPLTRVRNYPVHEAYRALWIWMGDPALADPARIPDLAFLSEAPESVFSKGYICGRGNYQLFTDNILDLTHADFLHPDTLGGGTFTRTRAKIVAHGDTLAIHWYAADVAPSPVMASRLPAGTLAADTWTEVQWHPPAVMVLHSGAVPTGLPRAQGNSTLNLHSMTPETDRTTHYFYAATRNHDCHDMDLNRRIAERRDRIFATEDEPMIAGQQERLGETDFWELQPALMRIDEGAVRVRRILERLIATEHNSAVPDTYTPEPTDPT